MKGDSSCATQQRDNKVRTVTCTICHGSGIPVHQYIKKCTVQVCGRVERKHLPEPNIQPNSNRKLAKHVLIKKENIPRGKTEEEKVEENYKEGIKQY